MGGRTGEETEAVPISGDETAFGDANQAYPKQGEIIEGEGRNDGAAKGSAGVRGPRSAAAWSSTISSAREEVIVDATTREKVTVIANEHPSVLRGDPRPSGPLALRISYRVGFMRYRRPKIEKDQGVRYQKGHGGSTDGALEVKVLSAISRSKEGEHHRPPRLENEGEARKEADN